MFSKEYLNVKLQQAAKFYWRVRKEQAVRQKNRGKNDVGSRGQVTGGKQLDGFAKLVKDIGTLAGFHDNEIFFNASMPLPGYYRPQKNWDVVFVRDGKLIAAIELKSQSGSFGNNFNNRSEEVLGLSRDFWISYREKVFGVVEAPWLGYFFFLEESEESCNPVTLSKSLFPPMNVFIDTSYLRRYEILCERLMLERDYNATALVISKQASGDIRDGGENVTAYAFFKSLYSFLKTRL